MYSLEKVERADDWHHLHEIRRKVLFDTGIFPFVYNEDHPDDRRAGNVPYLLRFADTPIGVARLDKSGVFGVVRLVGISSMFQGQGHGRALSNLIDVEAASRGITELRVNAFKDAIGFYDKTGWTREIWDAYELARLEPRNVQMTKSVVQTSA